MNRVLITGINGFIGSHIARYYLSKGYDVLGIDICDSIGDWKTVVCNLMSYDINELLNEYRPDIVVHCAGIANVSYSVSHPDADFEANTACVHRLLFALYNSGLKDTRVLFLSSAGVYGQPDTLPITEDTETNPISPYALHKRMAEDICSFFINVYGMDIRIARIFSAYGPGLRKQIFWDMYNKVIANDTLQLYGTGEETRDFIYIDDLVEALGIIALAERKNDYIFNVANGVQISIATIARIFVDELDKDIAIEFNNKNRTGDPDNWCADISRITSMGYSQRVALEEGIRSYIAWVKEEA